MRSFSTIITTLLTGCLLSLTACKKEDTPQLKGGKSIIKTYKLDTIAIEYVKIPLNRVFIYKDSGTGSLNTVRVTESSIEKKYQPEVIPQSNPNNWGFSYGALAYYYETYNLILKKTSGAVWFSGVAGTGPYTPFIFTDTVSVVYDSGIYLKDKDHNLGAFWQPFTSTNYVNTYHFITNIVIEGNSYTDVHKFISNNGLQPSEPNFLQLTYYWVKGIGIIKREIRKFSTVETYSLVSYH